MRKLARQDDIPPVSHYHKLPLMPHQNTLSPVGYLISKLYLVKTRCHLYLVKTSSHLYLIEMSSHLYRVKTRSHLYLVETSPHLYII